MWMLLSLCQNSDSWFYSVFVTEEWNPGRSLASIRAASPSVRALFINNHLKRVGHHEASVGYQSEYILFCSFLSWGQKYKTKPPNGAMYSTKYSARGIAPGKQQQVLHLSQRLRGPFSIFKSWQLSWCLLMNQLCLQNKGLLGSFVYFEE